MVLMLQGDLKVASYYNASTSPDIVEFLLKNKADPILILKK